MTEFKHLQQLIKEFEKRNNLSIMVVFHGDGSCEVLEFWEVNTLQGFSTTMELEYYLKVTVYKRDPDTGRCLSPVVELNGKHLRLHMQNQFDDMHPQEVMRHLGITYQHATPQSIGDQWWFWNCENIPQQLPQGLEPLLIDPFEAVGYGLSKEDAEKISQYRYKK